MESFPKNLTVEQDSVVKQGKRKVGQELILSQEMVVIKWKAKQATNHQAIKFYSCSRDRFNLHCMTGKFISFL